MADETNIDIADASDAPAVAPPTKKPRQPRKAKPAAEAIAPADTIVSEVPVKKTRAKRGSKATPAKVPKTSRSGASDRIAAATALAKPVSSTSAPADEFADLIKLEEENRSLRKQLSEKLRAENADLRKRLGQN